MIRDAESKGLITPGKVSQVRIRYLVFLVVASKV